MPAAEDGHLDVLQTLQWTRVLDSSSPTDRAQKTEGIFFITTFSLIET